MKIPKKLIFNFFSKQILIHNSFLFLGRRLNSTLMDYAFMIGLVAPFMILLMIPLFILDEFGSQIDTYLFGLFSFLTAMFIIINKDFFKGKSIAKRFYGYQIVERKNMQPANETRCILRNSTLILWPIEALVLIISPSRRVGDLLAGTILIDSSKEEPEKIMSEINEYKGLEKKGAYIFTSIAIMIINCLLVAFSNIFMI